MSKDADRRVGKRAWGQMILTLALALVSTVTSLWGQGHDSGFNAHWVGTATGQGDQQVNAVAVDMFGQVHSAGYFTGATAFGGLSVTNAGQFDFFALRHSRAGDLLWARSGGGPGQDACLAVAADAEGNTLAAGYFSAGARFDGQLLSHVGSADAVILKLNPAGAVIWIKVMGGPGDDRAYGISVAGDGSIYVAGHAQAGATIDSTTVGNAGGADAFLLKLASDGTPVWVRNGGGPAGEVAWSVAAVPAGGAVISGYADDQARFGDQVVSSFGNVDFFAAFYDSSGNLRWVRSGGGTGQDNGYAVAATPQGSVWLAGSIRGEARFGEIVMSGTGQRAFVSRIEPDGSVAWARTLPGTEARGLAADAEGVLVTGHFLGRATFDTHLLENQGNLDVFLARLETTAAVTWARSFGGPGSDQGFGINAHPEHGLGLAGRFSLTVDFDQRDVTSLGGGDGFVTKLSRAPVFVTLPEGRTVGPGVDVSLFGQAMGASPLHYQWFFNESEPVAGATENQLDLGAVDFDRKGLYSLEVSNAFGRAISPPVFLNVFGLAKPRIRINGASGGAFDLTNAAAVTLELSHELIDARLYYTLDGSEPSSGSLRYSAPITLSTTAVIRAIAYDQALASSQTAAIPVRLHLTPPEVLINGISSTSFSFTNVDFLTVELRHPMPQTAIHYSLNGIPPEVTALSYTAPFTVTQSFVLHATASREGMTPGETGPVSVRSIRLFRLEVSSVLDGQINLHPPGGVYLAGTEVQLDAQAAPGWAFMAWTGDATGLRGQTSVRMDRPRRVGAIFGTRVQSTSVGEGNIELTPANELHPRGAVIRAAAAPSAGNYFALWGGVASGASNPTVFQITGPVPTVSALFSRLNTNQVTLTVLPTGRGRIRIEPEERFYLQGSQVRLEARPDEGERLLSWDGIAESGLRFIDLTLTNHLLIRPRFSEGELAKLWGVRWSNGTFTVRVQAPTGQVYRIERSTNLVDWSLLSTIRQNLPEEELTDSEATNIIRAYRALIDQ